MSLPYLIIQDWKHLIIITTISKPFKENKQYQRKCFRLTWSDISCTFMLPKIHPINLSSMHLDVWKI